MKIRPFSHKNLVSKQIIYGQAAIIQDRIPKKFGTKSAKNTNYNCSIKPANAQAVAIAG
jgi:hypothetical protein